MVQVSVILIIDRSRTPGSLQPLGSFLFTGVAVKELTSPTSLRHWICQKHSQLSLWCLTQAESRSQYSHLESLSRSCLKFRGGNDDGNGIYSSAAEVISNAISFVNPLHGAVAKNARASHTRWDRMCQNSTFNGYDSYFDEVSPIPRKGIQLRSTTPIHIYMAPGRVYKSNFVQFCSVISIAR